MWDTLFSSTETVGSYHVPRVPLDQLGGRQPSIAWCDGRGDPRASHGEQKLETNEAASQHGQLSHLHHSPENSRRGDRNGWRGCKRVIHMDRPNWWQSVILGKRNWVAMVVRGWSGTFVGSEQSKRMKEIKKRGKKGHTHGPFYESDIRVLDKQGSWLGETKRGTKGKEKG